MKKKILSLALAGIMVLSASSVAQAATGVTATDGVYSTGDIDVSSEVKVPTISITMSDATGKKVAINPYGLTTTVTGVSGDDLKGQLVNKVETITNASDVKIAVSATTSATVGGNAKLATAEVKDTEKANAVFAYLQVEKGSTITKGTYNAKDANKLVFGAKAATKTDMVVLDDTTGTDKAAAYQILGSVATNPDKVWATTDTVDFKIVFTFKPSTATA